MKARLLVGLLTVALGGLTSCSNILEENGVINNVAESGMGELRINLTTDPTVEAITKASENLTNFTVKINNTEHSYEEWKGNKPLTVAVGNNITVEAYNKKAEEVENFAWNEPYYKGENTDVDIVAGKTATVTINCTRANSTLVVDTTRFGSVGDTNKILYVKSLKAYAEEQDNSDTNGFDLLNKDGSSAAASDSVCVKAGIKARIELVPAKMADGRVLDAVTTYISSDKSAQNPTEAAKRYKVSYTVNDKNGQATITVKVNNTVIEVPIGVEVNPYGSTTQENQSTDGDGE